MKCLLLFPPHCLPYEPWSTIPALTTYLRAHGTCVTQRDLNIELYHRFLSRDYLDRIRGSLERELGRLESVATLGPAEQQRLLDVLRGWALSASASDQIDEAKRTLTDAQAFYDFAALSRARKLIANAFRAISAAYPPVQLTHESFDIVQAHATMASLLRFTEDPDTSPFIPRYEEIRGSVTAGSPQLVGISISLQDQVLPGLTLSRMVKRWLPDATVVLGGYALTKIAARIARQPEFFRTFADYLVVGEGEKPLLALVQALGAGHDPPPVPGLLGPRSSSAMAGSRAECLRGSELLAPDYDGFPLGLYLGPEKVLPVAASRGCYWGRCGFCDRGEASGFPYRPRPADAVADDLQILATRHGARHFTFTDDAIAPKLLGEIAQALQDRQLDVRLSADSRFDAGFTPELCGLIARAGFVHLRFGLESASDRVLQLLRKGTNRARIEAVLQNLSRAGVCAHLYAFFGFPGETESEADETVAFVKDNASIISSASCTTFGLLDQSPAFLDPRAFGITAVDPASERLFKYFFDCEWTTGESAAVSRAKAATFLEAMARHYADYHVLGNLEWGHQFLYCAKFGFKSPLLSAPQDSTRATGPAAAPQPSSCAPALAEGVYYHDANYNLAEIAENLALTSPETARPLRTGILYDSRTGRIAALNQDASAILALCDSRNTVSDIASELSTRYSVSRPQMQGAVETAVAALATRGFLVEGAVSSEAVGVDS